MIPVDDPFMAGIRPSGLQRGRGGFLRSADDAPYVSDPSGEVCKTGDRKGEVKRLKYGSPSNRGREIENDAGLVKYKQRLSLVGIGMSDDLARACKALVDLPVGSPEFNSAADAIAVEADKLTRSSLAADRGIHGHLLTEAHDTWMKDGDGADPRWLEMMHVGEGVGISQLTSCEVLRAWVDLLRINGLEILAVEASCVDDTWRLAGTLDRIVRTTRPLTFVKKSGELVVIPAYVALILDIKFGKLRPAHPIQCASYDQSVPYDTDTETRGDWGFELSHEHALIAHGDFGDDTRPVTIELVWVDLVAGRNHGGQCVVDAKSWAARDDVFSVAQIVSVEGVEPPAAQAPATPSTDTRIAELATINDFVERIAVGTKMFGKRYRLDIEPLVVAQIVEGVGEDCPALASETTPSATVGGEAGAVVAGPSPASSSGSVVVDLNPQGGTISGGGTPDRLALVDARNQLITEPDQGADLSVGFDELWDQLHTLFQDLPPDARRWRSEMVMQATQRHVPFNVQTVKTERTYHLNSAIIGLAIVGMTDEVLRGILALVVGDVALFPSIQTGHLVGSLGVKEAERFAELADAYIGDRLESYVDDGCLRYREPFSPPPAA